MDQQVLQRYEPEIQRLSRLYYGLYLRRYHFSDVDTSDFEQAGRIAVWNISRKRPEKLDSRNYVRAAIKYSIIDEMKKMRHKVKQIYLVREHEEMIQAVDVLPTKEKGERLDELEELLYRIRHEFSEKEASALEALLEKCDNIYDLNLSEPPSTETKDRVKVVTRMDLNDEEMLVYAEVLLGARGRFPSGYTLGDGGKRRAQKFMSKVLIALGKSPKDFLKMRDKTKMIEKYSLMAFYRHAYNYSLLNFMQDFDGSLTLQDMVLRRNHLPESKIEEIVDSYEKFDGNATRAAKSLGCSLVSLIKYWRLHGLGIREYGDSSIPENEISKIVESHKQFNGNTAKAAQQLNRSAATIQKYWGQAGFSSINEGKNVKKSENEVKEILDAYGLYDGNASEAARHLGFNYTTILRYWKKQGFGVNSPGHPTGLIRKGKRKYWLIGT